MFKNYLKVAFRNIVRHKAFSLINIAGLAIGMSCSIFILLWVQNELSYDRFHEHADQIYRITGDAGDFKAAVNTVPMPPALKEKFPIVKDFVRLSHPVTSVFEVGANKFEEKKGFYADSTFLQFFTFPLVRGNARTALTRPDAVLITEAMAKKIFRQRESNRKNIKKRQ
jgi:hypothetical protein